MLWAISALASWEIFIDATNCYDFTADSTSVPDIGRIKYELVQFPEDRSTNLCGKYPYHHILTLLFQ